MDEIRWDSKKHGLFVASPMAVDKMIRTHLPASPNQLRNIVQERTEVDFSDVSEVSAFLVILASFEDNNAYCSHQPVNTDYAGAFPVGEE